MSRLRGLAGGASTPSMLLSLAALGSWWRLSSMISLSGDDARMPMAAVAAHLTAATALMAGLLLAAALRRGSDRRRFDLWAGLAFCLLFWAAEAAMCWNGKTRDHDYVLPVAALFAYATAGLLSRRRPEAELIAWDAVFAVVGGVYTLGALSKLRTDGLAWLDPRSMQLMIASQVPWSTGALRSLREALSHSAAFAQASSLGTLAIEGSGVLLAWPRWRLTYLAALLALHAMIYLGTDIFWPAQMVLLAALAAHAAQDRPAA